MKNFYLSIATAICLFSISTIHASENMVCSINSFSVSLDGCDNEEMFLLLEIDATEFGVNGFTIETNGSSQFYASYDPNGFYGISVIATCGVDIIVSITDADDPNCTATFNYGPSCCPCEIWGVDFEATACDNGLFDMEIDLYEVTGSCTFYDWKIVVDGVDYVLENINKDNIWDAFDIMAADSLITFELCSFVSGMPCETYTIVNPCFVSICSIELITAYTDVNTCEGEIIDIVFDITATNFGINGFTLSDGIATETFDLNDNFSFTTTSQCDEDVELTFTDLDDPDCNEIITITPDCCECIVDDILANPTACTNGSFDVQVDMLIESGSCISYDWFITIEGTDYDLVWNGGTLVASNITASDSLITAMVCTLAPSGECFTVEFENPCFVSAANCMISSFTADYDDTSCTGEIIIIEFEFNATDFGANGFTVEANGQINGFNLGDPYMIYMITLCDQDVELILIDNDDPTCTSTITLGPACCDCIISDPVLEASDCENGTFDIFMDFFDNEGTCVNYDWFLTIEGQNYDLTWNSNEQQYEAFDITASGSVLTVKLCNESPLMECFTYTLDNPCFDPNSNCSITSFTADYNLASCDGEIIMIDFDFVATDFGSNGFTVEANGNVSNYNLGDPYMVYMITLCNQYIELILTDNDDPNCTATIILGPACCDCANEDPVIETSDCENETFDIFIDFFTYEGTCVNYDWFLTIDGQDFDLNWNSSSQQYEAFDISNTTDSLITILLCNESPLMECFTYIIENPCFDSSSNNNCNITSFTADYNTGSCEGEIIMIDFEFVATDFGTNGFTVEANGNVSSFNLGDPYMIYMITLCDADIELILTDNDDPDCTASLILGPACCDCEISDPVIETSDCDNGTFDIFIDFFTNEGTCINYDWFLTIDGQDFDLDWNSSTQQYEAFDIDNTTDTLVTVLLCNESPLMECFTYTIDNPCIDGINANEHILPEEININTDASGNLIIDNNSKNDLHISMWTINGIYISKKTVYSYQANKINATILPDGVYLIKVNSSNGHSYVKKWVLIK